MASDPTPEEELPPRLRFERLVKGPEPTVFRSVRPDPSASEEPPTDGVPNAEPDSDAEILRRFEQLKEKLGSPEPAAVPPPSPARPVAPRPPATPPPGEPKPAGEGAEPAAAAQVEGEDGQTLDQLQARIRDARREEQEVKEINEVDLEEPAVDEHDDTERLTYDELERLKQREARNRLREAKKEKRRRKRKSRSFWQELPVLIVVALVVAVIIKTFFFQAFYIPSGSMIPTLEINDRVLVNKLSYRFGAIERTDILVFDSPEALDIERSLVERVFRSIGEATGLTSPETVLIKRVIALPGQTVEIRDNQVYVNDSPIAEPYLPEGVTMRDFAALTVPADHVFMMGDNRNQSRDSRVFGPIPREDIVGRAFVKVWPPGVWGGL
ncbi:MAG: signal peptidase I [Acidimicrobiia bacterium]|nr:signal peptidase I [Acidimicrobiia bacterium]